MKKIFVFLFVLFWSMIFPSLSFNSFTTEIIDDQFQYSDLFNPQLKTHMMQNAQFEFKLFVPTNTHASVSCDSTLQTQHTK